MRTLIAPFLRWLCGLLFPANGTHRAEPEAVAPEAVAVPVQRRTPPPLDGHEVALIRPYFIAWEQASTEERERILRRNRRMDAAEVAA
ncbi:hypothetical protein [Streptomyces sp. NPDC001312]|uniref:hypothetical protein n=1 Tax=Streptomyces sp. NPDC001312 TaxID=3364561 RepID=UPI003691AC60